MPCPENMWRASSASVWWDCLQDEGECSPYPALAKGAQAHTINDTLILTDIPATYQPLNIKQELSYLYKNKIRRPGLGDFTTLLLLMGVFRAALQLRRGSQEALNLQLGNSDESPRSDLISKSLPKSFPGFLKIMDCLGVLSSDDGQLFNQTSLKATIQHHYHTMGILLGLSLAELFCYCGFRVTSEDVSRCRNRLRLWIHERSNESRRVAMHAGRLFGHMRRSNMHGYYEGRAMVIACQSLWIFGELTTSASPTQTQATQTNFNESTSLQTVRLDLPLSKQDEQAWILAGVNTRPYLAGVGCILGPEGVARLIQEGSRILYANRTWGFCRVMGKALKVWHQARSGGGLQ